MTLPSQDRIKLAEAMGWHQFNDHWQPPSISPEECQRLHDGRYHINWAAYGLPDPFTDANDDYAVLEWMRSLGLNDSSVVKMDDAYNALPEKGLYKVGDYARAALKVIGNE